MWAELRFEFEDNLGLEVVGQRDGRRVTFFGEGISAPAGGELDAATLRLERAGYRVTGWRAVDGGWDGDVASSRTPPRPSGYVDQVRVLRSPDGEWRLEVRGAMCTLYRHGGVVLERAGMTEVGRHLAAVGVDVTEFVED